MAFRHGTTHSLLLITALICSACEDSPPAVVDVGLFDAVPSQDARALGDAKAPRVSGAASCGMATELLPNIRYEGQSTENATDAAQCLGASDKGLFYKVLVPSQHALTVRAEANFNIFVDVLDSCNPGTCERLTAASATRDRQAYFSNSGDAEREVLIRVGFNATGSFSAETTIRSIRSRAYCETPEKVEANTEVFAGTGALQEWCGDSTGLMFYSVDIPPRSFLSAGPDVDVVSCDCEDAPDNTRNDSDSIITATMSVPVGSSTRFSVQELPLSAFCETAPSVPAQQRALGINWSGGGRLMSPCGESEQMLRPHYFKSTVAPGETITGMATHYPTGADGQRELVMWHVDACDESVCGGYVSSQILPNEQTLVSIPYTNRSNFEREVVWGIGVRGEVTDNDYGRLEFSR